MDATQLDGRQLECCTGWLMSTIAVDLSDLLEPVSLEAPCGANLEYEPEFRDLEKAAQGMAVPVMVMVAGENTREGPNWQQVQNIACELLSRSKDLRIAARLTAALVHTEGFGGLAAGLSTIHGLLERYWDTVHPQLDAEDNNDPTMRINALLALCDREGIVRAVRTAPLVHSQKVGFFSLRDIDIAEGRLTIPTPTAERDSEAAREVSAPANKSTIDAAFADCELGELEQTSAAVSEAHRHLAAIDALLGERLGVIRAPSFDDLERELAAAKRILADRLSRRGVTQESQPGPPTPELSGAGGNGAGSRAARIPLGEISSREDVIRALERVSEYFKRSEPSSPIPLLIDRAKRLVSKSFLEILQDIAPDGVPQAENACGVRDGSENGRQSDDAEEDEP